MAEVQFMEKELIEPGNQRLEVLSGPQVAFKLKVVGGEHDGYTFVDYATRDEDTGNINQGTKAWSIFEACLGVGFSKKIKRLQDIEGRQFMAKVEHTKTGSRNKVEFGTIGPLPREAQTSEEDDDFSDIPF
jgi:hypothetical protein